MLYGLGGFSVTQAILQGKRNARCFGIRSAIDQFYKAQLEWSAVCGGKKDEKVPEPMVEYQGRFRDFCVECLGIEPWSAQLKIAESVEANEKTTVAACYASGKTFIAACLVLYWLFTRRPAMVVTTAPTGRQVKGLLWREVRKLYKKAKHALKGRLLQTRLEFADDWQGFGFSSDGGNACAGIHEAANVFFIIDEAAGIEQAVFEDFDGITASANSRMLLIGNPICQSGPFYDSHLHPIKSKEWVKINIRAVDTPNYLAKKTIIGGLVEWKYVEDKRKLWGENSPLWKMKILGEFVTVALDKVIPEAWVIMAQERWKTLGGLAAAAGRKVLGVDVAGGGRDETVVYLRQGRILRFVKAFQEGDHKKLFKLIQKICLREEPDVLYLDATQIGKGLGDFLAEASGCDEDGNPGELGGTEVVRIYSNVGPDEPEHFANRASEIAFALRAHFDPSNEDAIAVDPEDTQLATELSSRLWQLDEKNLVRIESKREMKKRGVGSPDRADSAAMTCQGGELIAA